MNRLISIIGMIGVLGIAYASDRVRDGLREAVGRTFDPSLVRLSLWVAAAANLILAACILALAWLACIKSPKSRGVATLFLMVGLFLLLSPSLSNLLGPIIRGPLPFGSLPMDAWLFHMASFVAVIGIVNLIVRR